MKAIALATLILSSAASASAHSGEAYMSGFDAVSTRTRAEVQAEASAALRAGLIQSGDGYMAHVDAVSTRTRAEVQAETIAALRNGEIPFGESYPFNMPAQKARADVKAQMASNNGTPGR